MNSKLACVKSLPLFLLVVSLAVTVSSSQEQPIKAKLSTISVEECRRGQHSYDLDLEGVFQVENASGQTILVPRNLDMVEMVMGARTAEQLQTKPPFVMFQELSAGAGSPEPVLTDFVVLKPGERAAVEMGVVLSASTDPSESEIHRIKPGENWLKLQYSSLPSSISNRGDFEALKKRWQYTGTLIDGHFLTEPFRFDFVPNETARDCTLNSQARAKRK